MAELLDELLTPVSVAYIYVDTSECCVHACMLTAVSTVYMYRLTQIRLISSVHVDWLSPLQMYVMPTILVVQQCTTM